MPAKLTNRLGDLADELETLEARRAAIYVERLSLWLNARAARPPVTQRALADASRVSENAVTQALRKHAMQNGAAP